MYGYVNYKSQYLIATSFRRDSALAPESASVHLLDSGPSMSVLRDQPNSWRSPSQLASEGSPVHTASISCTAPSITANAQHLLLASDPRSTRGSFSPLERRTVWSECCVCSNGRSRRSVSVRSESDGCTRSVHGLAIWVAGTRRRVVA